MCAASAKKLLPKTKPSSPPPGCITKRLSNRVRGAKIWHGMTLSSEQILEEASGQTIFGVSADFQANFQAKYQHVRT